MQVFGRVDLHSDVQLFLLLLYLVLGSVADADSTSTGSFFLPTLPLTDLLTHGVMADILVRW